MAFSHSYHCSNHLTDIKRKAGIFMSNAHYERIACMPPDWIQVLWQHQNKIHDLFFFNKDLVDDLFALRSDQLQSFLNQANLGVGGHPRRIYESVLMQAPPVVIVTQPLPQPVYIQPAPQPVYQQPYPQPVYAQPQPQPVYSAQPYPVTYISQPAPVTTTRSPGPFGMFGQPSQTASHHHHHDFDDIRSDMFRDF